MNSTHYKDLLHTIKTDVSKFNIPNQQHPTSKYFKVIMLFILIFCIVYVFARVL